MLVWLRRRGLEVAGWALVVAGLAALVLPGPGFLMLAAGLGILAFHYRWARRLVEPVKDKGLRAAAYGVETWPRIAASALGGISLVAVGVVWGLWRQAPQWWPLSEAWWLPGGWGTGATLIVSGVIALGLIVYSVRRFRTSHGPA